MTVIQTLCCIKVSSPVIVVEIDISLISRNSNWEQILVTHPPADCAALGEDVAHAIRTRAPQINYLEQQRGHIEGAIATLRKAQQRLRAIAS